MKRKQARSKITQYLAHLADFTVKTAIAAGLTAVANKAISGGGFKRKR